MKKQHKLSKINLYDKFNAAFVSMITPEMKVLNRIREKNSYSDTPTLTKPFEMPLEFINIDGVKIRVSKSVINGKNCLVLGQAKQSLNICHLTFKAIF